MVIVIAILFLMGALVGANPSFGNTVPVQPDTPVARAMASAPPLAILNQSSCRFAGSNLRDLRQPFASQTANGDGSDCGSR